MGSGGISVRRSGDRPWRDHVTALVMQEAGHDDDGGDSKERKQHLPCLNICLSIGILDMGEEL